MAKLECERSKFGADYQDVPRPVTVLSDEYTEHNYDAPHTHKRAQLIFAVSGVMAITTDQFSFVVPPQRAVWMPAGIVHALACRGPVSLRTLYIDPAMERTLPEQPCVIKVSNLLRELILTAAKIPILYDVDGRDGRLMMLLLDEIAQTRIVPLCVPMPRNRKLALVCETILSNVSDTGTIGTCSEQAGMSRRTFTRTFRKETGMSFTEWCRDVRLLEAVSLLGIGRPVTSVAFDVGYNSSSAFAAVFRRAFGTSPSRYIGAFRE